MDSLYFFAFFLCAPHKGQGSIYFATPSYKLISDGQSYISGMDDSLYYRNIDIDKTNGIIKFSLVSYTNRLNELSNPTLDSSLIPWALYVVN